MGFEGVASLREREERELEPCLKSTRICVNGKFEFTNPEKFFSERSKSSFSKPFLSLFQRRDPSKMKDIYQDEDLTIPEGVKVTIKARTVVVEGPRGTLTKVSYCHVVDGK